MNSITETQLQPSVEKLSSYDSLIREAFIDPIQTVTVIDDEYPTLPALLEAQLHANSTQGVKPKTLKASQLKVENIERLKAIIKMCHESHNWCVDVYDGQSPKFGTDDKVHSNHINHSDLLILDYHLDTDSDDGSRARNILKSLSSNNHFNLVVVHTKGVDNDIEEVFSEILESLVSVDLTDFKICTQEADTIEEWLDDNDPTEQLYPRIYSKYDIKDIIRVTTDSSYGISFRNPKHPFNHACSEILEISEQTNLPDSTIFKWLFLKSFNQFKEVSKASTQKKLDWDFNQNNNFISTGRIFITVVKKETSETVDAIYDKLYEALRSKRASPMYLLMAKIRQELDARGIEQANTIIDNHHAQAGWLFDLLQNSEQDHSKHHDAIDRHWEQLSIASKDTLIDFSKRIVSSLKETNIEDDRVVESFFPNCLKEEFSALKHLNAYASTRKVASSHIITGSVFCINDNQSKEYWICLTPACDLIPSQCKPKWQGRIGDTHMPFQAIKLIESNDREQTVKNDTNGNERLFIDINGEICTFKFRANPSASPTWETVYAIDHGKLDDNKLKMQRLRMMSEKTKTKKKKGSKSKQVTRSVNTLKLTDCLTAEVICELRYEYALNLLQKFGTNQTRVGLGFVDKLWN